MAKQSKKLRVVLARLNAIDVGSGEPPSEFRIFTPGVNETTKGDFVFDEEAAKLVMQEYARHGVEMMIDLEHFSLPDENDNVKDPDARGWCTLEMRGAELWAANVRWTPDGDQRLRERRQRYISPAFAFNADSLQITRLYNIAICAIPATYEAPPLMAASKRSGAKLGTLSIEVKKMDFLKMVCKALGLAEDTTAEDAMKAIKALAEEPDGDEGGEEKKKKEEAADDPEDKEKMAAQLSRLGPKTRGKLMAALSARETLSQRLADLEAKHEKSEREALITANVNKLPKSLESWAKSADLATLSAFFKDAPVIAKTPHEPPKDNGAANQEEVKLTAEDIKFAKLAGTPLDTVLAHKKKKSEEAKQLQAAQQ
jgi:phage I-like protein